MVIDEENFFVAVCQKWARYLRDGAVPQLMQATILQPSCPWLTTKALRSVWSLKTEYREYISNAHWELWQPTSNFGRVPWDFPLLTIIGNLFNCWNGISRDGQKGLRERTRGRTVLLACKHGNWNPPKIKNSQLSKISRGYSVAKMIGQSRKLKIPNTYIVIEISVI